MNGKIILQIKKNKTMTALGMTRDYNTRQCHEA